LQNPVPPIECLQARESASALLDAELPELDDARLAVHLRGCAECRAYAGELAALTAGLRDAPLKRPEIEIFAPRSRRVPTFRAQAAAAAVALIAVAAGSSFALGRALGGSPGSRPTAATGQNALGVQADSAQQHLLAMLSRDPVSPNEGAAHTGRFQAV
jgi:predicted anti-sigma-YlaC factor YlaD